MYAQSSTFQSTRPVWGATTWTETAWAVADVSIHAPRVGRDTCVFSPQHKEDVSIHAPRVGRDAAADSAPPGAACFNPRAPCGARLFPEAFQTAVKQFQSTRPVWGATDDKGYVRPPLPVSIHAPRVGRDHAFFRYRVVSEVSIHAPRVGRDKGQTEEGGVRRVSIHAPRVGRDIYTHKNKNICICFNPRAPCGARLSCIARFGRRQRVSIHAPRVGRDI